MNWIKELPWSKIALAFIAFLFVLFMAFSVVFESLLPLWRSGDRQMFARNLIGIPIIFLGVGLFVWSAILFLRDTFRAVNRPEKEGRNLSTENNQRGESSQFPRAHNFRLLLSAWKPSAIFFILSVLLVAIGGRLIN